MQVTRDAGSEPALTKQKYHVLASETKDACNKSFCYCILQKNIFARKKTMCFCDREQIRLTIAAEANFSLQIQALV